MERHDKEDTAFSSKREEIDNKKIASAKEVISQLIKTIKAFRLYPRNNPIFIQFISGLKNNLSAYFDKYNALTLTIKPNELLVDGERVYFKKKREESLSFFFYRDGLRKLSFIPPLDERELIGFLEVIKETQLHENPLDDLVTRLWERNFSQIAYEVAEEQIPTEEGIELLLEEAWNTSKEYSGGEVPEDEGRAEAQKQKSLDFLVEELKKTKDSEEKEDTLTRLPLTEEEIVYIQEELAKSKTEEILTRVVDSLLYIIKTEGEDQPEVWALLGETLTGFFNKGEIAQATSLLERLNEVKEDIGEERFSAALKRMFKKDTLTKLATYLNQQGEKDENLMYYFFSLLVKPALPQLIELLGELEERKDRSLLCQVIADQAKDQIEVIASKLMDKRWYLVRNLVFILGKMGDQRALKHLRGVAHHPDSRVRLEVVRTLAQLGGGGAYEAISLFLYDRDPKIRSLAALTLAEGKYPKGGEILFDIVRDKEFRKRELDEKITFFKALGKVAPRRAISYLEKLLFKRSFFRKKLTNEMRLGAAYALFEIGTEEAKKILKRGRESRREEVKRAVLTAGKGKR
ncbi:MAG: HEAT repeat domain-containing protein [Acidobacteria bacterium]|nr:HEAT repeat domain-containing protein [Acidobacteriota bacterium]